MFIYYTLTYCKEFFEVNLPTIWTDEEQRWQESEKRVRTEVREEKRNEKRKSEDRRRRCADRQGSLQTLCCSKGLYDLRLWRVEE